MSDRVIALKNKHRSNYFLLPTPNDGNMIMELNGDGTWRFKEGRCSFKLMSENSLYEPLYEIVVD